MFLILVFGAVACYILGMAGLMAAAYIFLAVSLAPAVIAAGHLNTIAVHLFILYWVMLAVITPPVAIAVFAAAAIGGTDPFKTGLHAMRLALILYFIPFFFVYNPALVFQTNWFESAYLFALALVGIIFITGGLEGYLWGFGNLKSWIRPFLIIGGLLIVFPEIYTTIAGAVMIIFAVIILKKQRKVSMADQQAA